ncbi:MAG: helix-turn-helix domain-containing protein [Flavobacteriaceae bacterium]|nr:helix-turn-helix domain-containing protein [Flavobacteriaceae bacterium]
MPEKIVLTPDVLEIAKIAKALSHPVRVHIVKKLSSLDACCYSGDLVEELPVGRSTLSQHLKELKYAGLIQGEIDPPYIKYCINREKWEDAKTLMSGFFNENQISIKLKQVKSNSHINV